VTGSYVFRPEADLLDGLGSELFTSKSSSTRKRAVVTSAQQTKLWNREINDLLRLGPELFTSASMTASSSQKKKKQLIVKLRVRQQELKQKQKQKQNQEQEQRNNGISTNGQSGRGMRIRRAPKRFY